MPLRIENEISLRCQGLIEGILTLTAYHLVGNKAVLQSVRLEVHICHTVEVGVALHPVFPFPCQLPFPFLSLHVFVRPQPRMGPAEI